jgi:rSAM/selenodomain-associated transferase 1
MATDVLVVMARQPTPGAVKTRLAQAIGATAAAALYRAFLADIAATCTSPDWSLMWAVTPPDADLAPIVGVARQIAQRGDDLGARMHHVFADLFAGGAARVVMIGADAPHLGAARIAAAFAALERHDAVFIPTRDGGYCLVGLAAPQDLFHPITMGTTSVFAETLAQAARLGLRVARHAESFDIDMVSDLEALAGLLASGEVALPATAAALDAMCVGRAGA